MVIIITGWELCLLITDIFPWLEEYTAMPSEKKSREGNYTNKLQYNFSIFRQISDNLCRKISKVWYLSHCLLDGPRIMLLFENISSNTRNSSNFPNDGKKQCWKSIFAVVKNSSKYIYTSQILKHRISPSFIVTWFDY